MIRIADSHSDFAGFIALDGCKGRLYDHADPQKMLEGGVSLQVFAAWVPADFSDRLSLGFRQIEYMHRLTSAEENMILCASPEQLSAPGIKAVLAIESGDTIDCRVDMIQYVFELGARMMSLTWNVENGFGYGCHSRGGLKEKGLEAIRELNRLRMSLDISHLNYEGFWDAAGIYVYPMCASHSCCHRITPNQRNLKNDQIEYIIKSKGYIGVNFFTEFLRGEKASIGDILDHIEYILSMGGQCCVGLGSDFCGIQYTPVGLKSVADFQKIPEAMAKRNYSDDLIHRICYSNLERYLLKFL